MQRTLITIAMAALCLCPAAAHQEEDAKTSIPMSSPLLVEELIYDAGYSTNDSENLLKTFIEKELSTERIKYSFCI